MKACLTVTVSSLFVILLTFIWVGFWMEQNQHGHLKNIAGFDSSFNWHPFLMISGLVGMNFIAVVSFMTLPFAHDCKKKLHMLLHTIALLFAYVGIAAVLKSHNDATPPLQNFYSLHSWVGMTAVIIYTLQYIAAFIYFWVKCGSQEFRLWIKSIHMPLGKLLVGAVTVAVISGFQEKLGFNGTCTFKPADDDHDDDRRLHEGHGVGQVTFDCNYGNMLGMLVFLFAGGVLYILVTKREEHTPEQQSSLELEELEELTAMHIS